MDVYGLLTELPTILDGLLNLQSIMLMEGGEPQNALLDNYMVSIYYTRELSSDFQQDDCMCAMAH